MTIARQPNHFC